jgi:hypothetical protein
VKPALTLVAALAAVLSLSTAAPAQSAPGPQAAPDTQAAPDPVLEHRGGAPAPAPAPNTAAPPQQRGWSTLPADASGEYLLDEKGSIVEVTIDQGYLTGYVTKSADALADKDIPLTYYFDQAQVRGSRITFSTHEVHGLRYSFDGVIVRGDSQTRLVDGFYKLKGAWTTHNTVRNSEEASQVSFKSTPRTELKR